MNELRGAFTALITPMHENGEPDYDGFRELIRFQLAEGIDGIVPLGTTGETPTLEEDEEEKLIRIAVEEAKGKVPIIIGTGSNNTSYAVLYTRRARDLGADAALVVTPYYNKPNDEGLLRHFKAVAALGLPVIIYNIASRTGRNISAALIEELSRIPGIIGVKEASGDVVQMGDIIRDAAAKRRAEGRPFTVLSGDDGLTVPLIALGGDGVISVISNLVPGKVAALAKACLAGNFEEGRRLHYELLPLIKAAFIETNPIPIKAAMTWAGLPGGPARLPLGTLSPENAKRLYAVLESLVPRKDGRTG
ncbi:MAG: 4-hydroxy-tetrahydrodipicolinate synthase [Spirochaetaceae bacterium]|jgi:4-hydroxy-tetrahydrodipicolinate synthase|nr:4-hydroxy-tetrahydrodipicolinate synthase [Spirochaetaceae bacterium]